MNYAKAYEAMHNANPKHFSGYSIRPYVGEITALVRRHISFLEWNGVPVPISGRLLDYGSGKGFQYLALRVHDQWGGLLPHCYDPGVRQLREKPSGKFSGIICTDVMEHIEERDVPKTLADIFGFAGERAFVFFAIACRPAKRKRLPDGRDVHVTIKPPEWWGAQIDPFRRKGLTIRAVYDEG